LGGGKDSGGCTQERCSGRGCADRGGAVGCGGDSTCNRVLVRACGRLTAPVAVGDQLGVASEAGSGSAAGEDGYRHDDRQRAAQLAIERRVPCVGRGHEERVLARLSGRPSGAQVAFGPRSRQRKLSTRCSPGSLLSVRFVWLGAIAPRDRLQARRRPWSTCVVCRRRGIGTRTWRGRRCRRA
jgi:hypothetical protein